MAMTRLDSDERRKEIEAVSVMWYLTDVSPTDHCFCIVPEWRMTPGSAICAAM